MSVRLEPTQVELVTLPHSVVRDEKYKERVKEPKVYLGLLNSHYISTRAYMKYMLFTSLSVIEVHDK